MSSSRQPANSYSPPPRSLVIGQQYLYGWNRMGRKGDVCTLEVIGGKNSIQVQFADGHRAITSAAALKPMRPGYSPQPRMF